MTGPWISNTEARTLTAFSTCPTEKWNCIFCMKCCCLRRLLANFCLFWLQLEQFDPIDSLSKSCFSVLDFSDMLGPVIFLDAFPHLPKCAASILAGLVMGDLSPWNETNEANDLVSTIKLLSNCPNYKILEVRPFWYFNNADHFICKLGC